MKENCASNSDNIITSLITSGQHPKIIKDVVISGLDNINISELKIEEKKGTNGQLFL